MRRPHSVQVFLVRHGDQGFEYLLLQRRARPDIALPDFWQGVTGALEDGESHEQAAVREVWEETGLRIDAVQDVGFEQRFPIKPEWRKSYGPEPTDIRERVFCALVTTQVEPRLSHEHTAWRWVGADEARPLLTFGENGRCFSAVEAHLASERARTRP
jgi:8-oxo-dGTP pyrophosphatase MutT (NUDIX family)